MRVRRQVEATHEPERRSPTRRVATDHARAGSETGAPAWFMVPRRVRTLEVEAPDIMVQL